MRENPAWGGIVSNHRPGYKGAATRHRMQAMDRFGPLVDTAELARLLGEADLVVLDCRFDLQDSDAGRRAYLDAHIPGARYADLDTDLAAAPTAASGRHPLPDAAEAARRFEALGVGDNSRVVVYDSGAGAVAARAWWMLEWLGHGRVALLDGGYAAWTRAGLPVETGAVSAEPGQLSVAARRDDVVTTAELVAAPPGEVAMPLVDARDERRYRGEWEPIDPVAGHVPGAANLPFDRLVDDNGRFRSAEQIGALFVEALGGPPEGDWAVMCGSGVTACHLALGAELAGLTRPKLYVGSWSEWIRDPARDVATGA